jgi:hypothetical protein
VRLVAHVWDPGRVDEAGPSTGFCQVAQIPPDLVVKSQTIDIVVVI